MDFLKSLWPNTSSNVVNIPQHVEGELEDDLNLKVKALTYLFKRLAIESVAPFINDEHGFYSLPGDKAFCNEKLDTIYNKPEFERMMQSNGHRILADWFKNRFRSVCILSARPDSHFNETLSKNFHFVILPADSPDEVYMDVLIHSDIYVEHSVDPYVKRQILNEILKKQRQLRPSYKAEFNRNDRASVILQYVQKLSEVVQIERIYKASVIAKLEQFRSLKLDHIKETLPVSIDENEEVGIKLFPSNALRSRSPIRRDSNDGGALRPGQLKSLSPVKLNTLQLKPTTPSSSPSKASDLGYSPRLRSRSNSPVKSLKKKQSMTILKMDRSLSVQSDEVSEDVLMTKSDRTVLRQQAEQAVLMRVERELKVIRG